MKFKRIEWIALNSKQIAGEEPIDNSCYDSDCLDCEFDYENEDEAISCYLYYLGEQFVSVDEWVDEYEIKNGEFWTYYEGEPVYCLTNFRCVKEDE